MKGIFSFLITVVNVEPWICRQAYGLFALFRPEKAIISSCLIVRSGGGPVATAMTLHQAEGQSATTSGGHLFWMWPHRFGI